MIEIPFFDGGPEDPCNAPHDTPERRMARANQLAFKYAGIDGSHHKDWVIDQMVRALHGCPLEWCENVTHQDPSKHYRFYIQGRSEEYKAFVKEALGECHINEDGFEQYDYTWEEGCPP